MESGDSMTLVADESVSAAPDSDREGTNRFVDAMAISKEDSKGDADDNIISLKSDAGLQAETLDCDVSVSRGSTGFRAKRLKLHDSRDQSEAVTQSHVRDALRLVGDGFEQNVKELSTLREEHQKLLENLKLLQQQLGDQRVEVNVLNRQLQEMHSKMREKEHEMQQLEKELAEQKKEMDTEKQIRRKLIEERQIKDSQISELERAVEVSKRTADELNRSRSELLQELDQQRNENSKLLDEIRKTDVRNQQLQQSEHQAKITEDTLRNELEDKKTKLNQMTEELAKISILQRREIERLTTSLQQTRCDHQEDRDKLMGTLDEKIQKLKQLEAEKADEKQRFDEKRAEFEEYKQKLKTEMEEREARKIRTAQLQMADDSQLQNLMADMQCEYRTLGDVLRNTLDLRDLRDLLHVLEISGVPSSTEVKKLQQVERLQDRKYAVMALLREKAIKYLVAYLVLGDVQEDQIPEAVGRALDTRYPLCWTTTENEVHSIGQVGAKIYMIYKNSSLLHEFETNFKFVRSIPMDKGSTLTDLAVCHSTQSVFVASDYGEYSYILRYSVDKRSVTVWLPNRQCTGPICPRTISVFEERLLLVSRNKLALYGPDGAKLRETTVPENTEAEHAVETGRDTVIVCFSTPPSGVCELKWSGNVIAVCRTHQVQLSRPLRLAWYDKTHVIVADSGNNCVMLIEMGKQLKPKLTLLSGLEKPGCLCYLPDSNHLLIGAMKSLGIYKLPQLLLQD